MICNIEYEEILNIWEIHLWPSRISKIEPTSAMCYLGNYDVCNMNFTPTFIGYFEDSNIVGVNSGHMCSDGSYRSRGLFVFPKHRGKGIGIKLLKATIDQGFKESASFIWSYPKKSSWKTYQKAGFSLSSPWEVSELGFNAYCIKRL